LSTLCSIFSQVLKLIPRGIFDSAVREHQAERNAKGFTCLGQFVAMLFCQLGSVTSLRDITNGLAASEGKLRHLGLPSAPKRSTLAYAVIGHQVLQEQIAARTNRADKEDEQSGQGGRTGASARAA